MRRLLRPILATGVAAALVASSGVALAAPNGARDGRAGFRDLHGYSWAMPGILAMQGQGVLNGVSATSFDPTGLTTRAEMATVVGRFLGWSSASPGVRTRFADDDSIPSYALSYVDMASRKGIMQGLPGGAFSPQGTVTWAQLAVIVARALDYPLVPAAQVPSLLAQLPQGSATPKWAQEALARDIAAGDFTGVLADMYQPGQNVTRAELAAFMAQVEQGSSSPTPIANASVLTGQVLAVNGLQLTLQTSGGTQTLTVSPSATVYVGQTPGTTGDLQVGDAITAVLSGGQATLVNITSGPTTATTVGTSSVTGTLASVSSSQIGVNLPGTSTLYIPLAAGATVTLQGGAAGNLASLQVGDTVTVTINGSGQAVTIAAGGSSTAGTSTVTGTVLSLSGNVLTVTVGGSADTFALSSDVTVNGVLNDLGGLTAGETITLTLVGNQVTAIATSTAAGTSVTGVVLSVSGNTLLVSVSGTTEVFTLSVSTTVNGVLNDFAALVSGQSITVTAVGSQATAIQTSGSTATTTVSGTVISVSGSTLLLNVGGTTEVFTVSSSTTVNGILNDLGALVAGEAVTVIASGSQATSIQTNGFSATTTVTGSVIALSGSTLLVNVGGTTEVFTVTSSTTVNGILNDLAAVVAGETVTVTAIGSQATAIQTSGSSTTTTVSGTVASLSGYTLVVLVGGTDEAFTLTASTTVNGQLNDFGALASGTSVTLTVVGGQVSAIATGSGSSDYNGNPLNG
ncbi:MAG TPA: S-layer homology domain-containing protein, partial [Bacillota bacterium]|nr:S-layer homology domain-containing protein [Bacillota bacterium]